MNKPSGLGSFASRLCIQARRVFPYPASIEARGSTRCLPHDPRDPKTMNMIGTSSAVPRKEAQAQVLTISETPNKTEGASTSPPATATIPDTETSSIKGGEVPSSVHEEHGYVPCWTII